MSSKERVARYRERQLKIGKRQRSMMADDETWARVLDFVRRLTGPENGIGVKKMIAILSGPVIPLSGVYEIKNIEWTHAMRLLTMHRYEIYTGHESIRVLRLSPTKERKEAKDFTLAMWVKPRGRLEFGREYSIDEIEEIGYDIWLMKLIEKTGD